METQLTANCKNTLKHASDGALKDALKHTLKDVATCKDALRNALTDAATRSIGINGRKFKSDAAKHTNKRLPLRPKRQCVFS